MPKEDIDWSKLSGTVLSSASHALAAVKQMSDQVISPPNVNLSDLSKLSGTVLSRASDALAEVKQLSNQVISKKDTYLPSIDLSKVSGDILSHTSDALTEAKQLVYQISTYRHWNSNIPMFQQYQEKVRRLIEMTSNLFGVHWIKVWGSILLRASKLRDNILSGASQLWGIISPGALRLWRIVIWGPSKLCSAIIWGSSKFLGADLSNTYELRDTTRILSSASDSTAFSCVSHAVTRVNIWSIRHPYIAAAVLLWISEHPGILLAPLQTGKPTPHTRTSTVPLNRGYYDTVVTNEYENANARKAESTAVLSVSWLTGLGAVFVLGRRWGWWD